MKNALFLFFILMIVVFTNQTGHSQQKNCNGPFDVDLSHNITYTFDEVLFQLGIATLEEFNTLKPQFDMVIGGTLLLDKPGKEIAFYNTKIKMLNNARIDVISNTTLTLNNVHIYGCGNILWDKIMVRGTLNTLNNCKIEDARNGIQNDHNSKTNLQSTNFNNNRNGVQVRFGNILISDCSFSADNSFFSYQPFANGINVAGGLDYVDLSPNLGERNTFYNLTNGIVALHTASVRVTRSDFINMRVRDTTGTATGWIRGGYGIYLQNGNSNSIIAANTFADMPTAIRSEKANIRVIDNKISSETGVSIENVKRFYVAYNEIYPSIAGIKINSTFSYLPEKNRPSSNEIFFNTIELPTFSSEAYAIDLQLTEKVTIENNYITIRDGKAGILARWANNANILNNKISLYGSTGSVINGIHLESCSNVDVIDNKLKQHDYAICCVPKNTGIYSESSYGNFFCNKIFGENEYVGLTNAGMEFFHMCDNSRLSGNEWIGLAGKDLVLGSEDYDVPTIIGIQGDFTNFKGWGNKWTGMSGGSAYNYSDDYISFSRFLVNSYANPTFKPSTIIPSTNWFENDPLATNKSLCGPPNDTFYDPIMYDCTDLINKIIMIDTTSKYDECQKAIWKYHYFKKLLRMKKMNLLNPSCLSFLNAFNNNDLVKIAKVDSAITHILVNHATDSLLYANLLTTQSALNDLHDQGLVFSVQYQQTMAIYSQLLAAHSILMDAERAEDIRKADSVKNVIATINVRESCLQLLLGVMDVHLDYIKSDTLTPVQKTYVNGISQLCPIDMGEAVYLARSLRSIYDNVSYDRIEECAPARITPRSSENTLMENKLYVYPNPASDELNIAFEVKPNEKGTITITDMNGRLMKELKLTDSDQSLRLNVSDFNSGLYFIKYISLSGVESVEKFVISK